MFSFSSSSAPSLYTAGASAGFPPAAVGVSSVPSFSSSFPAATTAPAAPAAPATGSESQASASSSAAPVPAVAEREQDAHSEAELQTMLSLMRRRASAEIPPVEVFRDTNALLNGNLLSTLLREIERDVKSVQTSPSSCIPTANSNNNSNSNSNGNNIGGIQWEKLRVKAEIVFFALYQTQATPQEAALLLSLVELVSDVVASANIDFFFSAPTTAANAASSSSSTAAGANISAPAPAPAPLDSEAFQAAQQELAKPLLLLLVILQLAHCAAHQQTVALYSREREYASEREVAQFAEENSLPNPPAEKFALDRRAWRCRGAQAMSCLVYAVFRQPEVDEGRAPPQDVQWFLHEASVLRGYSYLRLVVLPVVQWLHTVDEETSLFYFSIVADLLENLSEIYCMSCYRSPEGERDRDRESSWEREREENALWTAVWEEFPRAFFAPTHEYYETHIEDYQPHSESLSHTGTEREANTQTHTQSARKRWSPLVLRSLSTSSSSLSLGPLSSSPTHAATHTHAQASLVLEDGVDTLQEVISLHCDFMQCYPAFAGLFWKEDKEKEPLDGLERESMVRSPLRKDFSLLSSAGKGANASVNMSERKRRGEREAVEKEREISVFTAHHFVTRLLAVCPSHASLWIPALQYLSALAESSAETARAVFFFLRSAESSPFHWRSLLRGVNTVAAHFTDARSLAVSASVSVSVSGADGSTTAAAAKREGEGVNALSAWDVPALHAVLDLFSAVARERDIALELCSPHNTHNAQANTSTNINTSINMNASSASIYASNTTNLGFGGNIAGSAAELSVLSCLVEVFSLSFPVEIKAAAVRCLAQLAAQDVRIARQVLVLFEGFADDHNANSNATQQSLVPLASQTQTPTYAQSSQSSQSALALSTKAVLFHFRQELEQRESVLGFYPLSEALLCLLQSLFSHGEGVQEGVGFKEPGGLLPYIDYTVHDLLLTTHQRPFSLQSPAVSAAGREGVAGVGVTSGVSGAERERERERDGARWRLCSRALAVLVTVLDRFPVAPTQTQTQTETERNPQTHTTYTPEELATRREKERERLCAQCETSLGFYTLSLVLSHSRLTELLSQIVRGVDRDFLAHTLARNMQRELQSVVHALLFFTPHSALPQHLTPLTQRAHTPSARLLSLLQSLSHAAPLSHTLTTPSHNLDRPFYLLHAKRENTINSLVWIERAIALCVSVVWHVARCERDYRERALSLFPRGDVCVWRFQGTRVTRVPCVPLTLSVWLAGDALTPCLLSLMAHNFRTQPTLPSVRVLVVQIVEYLAVCEAVHSHTHTPLSVGAPSLSVTGSGLRSSQQHVCALDALLVDDSVVETFSRALLGVPPSTQHTVLSSSGVSLSQSSSALSGSGEYVAMHSGGERRPFAVCARGLCGESSTGERGSVSERCVETLRGSFSLTHNSGSGVCEEDEAQTLRQAVLSLLLGTLSTQRSPTMHSSHSYSGFLLQLLGLSPDQQALSLSSSVKSQDCLDALLRLVHPVHGGVFSLSPSLSVSVDVYELLYRLVSSSAAESALAERDRQREVRRALLRRLRAPEVDFFATHLAFLLRLCECDVADVRQLCGLTQHSQTDISARDALCESVVLCEWAFSVRQALSWLLKIVECELVECRAQPHSVTHTQSAQSIISLLLDGTHTTHNTAQEAQIPLTRVLSVAAWETQSLCAQLLRRRVSPSLSPFVRDCLRYTRSVRAGSSVFFSSSLSAVREDDIGRETDRERFASADELPLTASPQYAYIDCRRLTQHLLTHRAFAGLSLDEKEELLFTAVEENVRNKLDAAASHLTLAWRSLTDYLCLSSYLIRTTLAPMAQASYLHPRTQESVRALARLVFACVCVSATETLALALREKQVFVKEQLVRSLLSTLSLCERLQEEYDVDCMEMVSEEHWQRVCELCVSVVRASSEVGELSFTLQGYCAAALEMMLRVARRAAQAHTQTQEETGDGVGVWMLNSFALVTRKHIRELSESLSRLAVKAHLAWRLVALSLLSSLFRLCVERESSGEGAGRRVLSILTLSLSQKGLLDDLTTALQRQFWVSLSPSVSSVSLTAQLSARERAGAATSGSPEEDGLELLDSALQFFSVLAETSEGRDGLVKTGLLDLLADLTVFRRYPVTNDGAMNGNSNKYNNNLTSASLMSSSSQSPSSSSSSMCVSFRKAFSSTLQFFSLFLTLSDARLDVLSGIASFLRKNHSTCSHVLRVRDLSFAGLQLAELVSHCLVCFASRCATLPEQGQSGTSEGGYARLVRWLGDDVDALLLDCMAAIELLDLNPILAILPNAALQSTFSATMRLSWFASISLPSQTAASAAQIARFESDKVFTALSALTNVVAFVRLATISGSQQTQQAGDKCVPSMLRLSLLRGLSAVFAQAVDMLNLVKNSSAVAVKGDSVVVLVHKDLHVLLENTISALYNLSTSSADAQTKRDVLSSGVRTVLQLAQQLPDQCFAKTVAKWLEDKLRV